MLTYLSVKNVSVIESASLEFVEGLTVLTGETGSGKSVLVGALKLLLGERFNKNSLREGADKLMVEGIFTALDHLPNELKEEFEIEDELIVRREADSAGKNRIFINGRVSTLSQLKSFAVYLADIHGQHEHQALLDESRHITLIDHLVPQADKDAYKSAYAKYTTAKKEYEEFMESVNEMKRFHEIAQYQYNEINSAQINLKEDVNLEETILVLSNIEKIREVCAYSIDALSEGEINAISLLSRSAKSLQALEDTVKELSPAVELLNSSLDNVESAVRILSSLFEKQNASPEELDSLIQRKYLLQELVRKYGGSLEEVVNTSEKLKEKLDNFDNSEQVEKSLLEKVAEAKKTAEKYAGVLLEKRKKVSLSIAEKIEKILEDLELPNSTFETRFTKKNDLDSSGGVEGVFYLSVNKGFEPAPLSDVASGGEISRIMLALKEVFSEADSTPTLLFDEIDTGISGKAAKKVAVKLKSLARKKQIIVITHLPVVAAVGESQFQIAKSSESGVTKTRITQLSDESRRDAIALMIAGGLSDVAKKQAEELINEGKKF